MILSDEKILEAIEANQIVISPFNRECLGTNSYDVHLGRVLGVYANEILDARQHNDAEYFEIDEQGYLLQPGQLYLASTEEYTESLAHVPFLEGKSSLARLGISIHCTAGKGDVGFRNYWTMEMTCVKPVRIYPGMKIGQLIYFEVSGEVSVPYTTKPSAKYTHVDSKPQFSQNYKNFQ